MLTNSNDFTVLLFYVVLLHLNLIYYHNFETFKLYFFITSSCIH